MIDAGLKEGLCREEKNGEYGSDRTKAFGCVGDFG